MRIMIWLPAVFFLSWVSFHTAAAAQPAAVPLTSSTGAAGSFDPAAATRTWLETIPTEKRAQSDAYFEGGYWLILWNFLLGAAISLFLLGSGLSSRLLAFAERTTRFQALRVGLYAMLYIVGVS